MDPNDVFLPADGTWRTAFSKAVTVAFHLDFKSYCTRLSDLIAIAAAATGTREIFLVGMEFALDIRMDDPSLKVKPHEKDWEKTIGGKLEAAAKQGVRVRILMGRIVDKGDSDFAKSLGLDSVVDDQMVPDSNPHHQKAVYFSLGDNAKKQPILFIGGADFATDRFQWFDVMAELSGDDGARLGLATMEERWSSVTKQTAPDTKNVVAKDTAPTYAQGETLVQYARMYGLTWRDKLSVRRAYPQDRGYLQLLINGIQWARKTIYLEDQFFSRTPELDGVLLATANQKVGPTIVVIGARVNENEQYFREVGSLRAKLKNQNRLVLLKLKPLGGRKPNLIHTKTWIFDDELAVIGSGNYWDGSFGADGHRLDSEFAVAVMDPQIAGLRLKMWNRLIASGGAAPIALPKGATFFDELGALTDRQPIDPQDVNASFLVPGSRSQLEAMPDTDSEPRPPPPPKT